MGVEVLVVVVGVRACGVLSHEVWVVVRVVRERGWDGRGPGGPLVRGAVGSTVVGRGEWGASPTGGEPSGGWGVVAVRGSGVRAVGIGCVRLRAG